MEWYKLKLEGVGEDGKALAELKTLNAGQAYLKQPFKHRAAIQTRADAIPKEYLDKAKKLDAKYNNGNPCVENHMRTFGRVRGFAFGSYAEWSKDVTKFLDAVCRIIAANEWRESGYQDDHYCYGVVRSNVNAELGVLSLQTVAQLMKKRFSNISTNQSEGNKAMEHDIYEYHKENRIRADLIREQNSINPNGATFKQHCRLWRIL